MYHQAIRVLLSLFVLLYPKEFESLHWKYTKTSTKELAKNIPKSEFK